MRPESLEIHAKSVLNRVTGMPFGWSINPYRGCYHQCVFCYARKSHSFLDEDGVSDWGSRIYVKVNSEAVLRSELAKSSWQHEHVAIGTVTDPYQPFEGRYKLMPGILSALADYDTPAHIITRSPLVVRDITVLQRLAKRSGVSVAISIATVDEDLAREIEPTVAAPRQRFRAVRMLADAGIRVNVALAPILPGITDAPENIRGVLQAARDAGSAKVWHNTLYLHEITRSAFFAYLRDRKPELVARYASTYRGKYAPRALHDEIDERVKEIKAQLSWQAPRFLEPQAPRQLSLI